VRTTLTLEEDVAARLKGEARKSGKSFKQVVNEALREGLTARKAARKQPPFKVKTRSMGHYPGLDYDNIGVLLEQVEGPFHK
jgi:hypothetical protein